MSTESNKAIVRRFFAEIASQGKLDLLDELAVPDYVHHDPAMRPETQRGRDAYKQVIVMFRSAFPDLEVTVEDVVGEGNEVAARWTFTGTHQGELMGIPPTDRKVTAIAISIHRFHEGKVVEGWVNFDALGLMQQLGAIPEMAEA